MFAMELPRLDELVLITDSSDLRKATSLWGRRLAWYFLNHFSSVSRSEIHVLPFYTEGAWQKIELFFQQERFKNTLYGILREQSPLPYDFSFSLLRRPSQTIAGALCIAARYDPTATLEE